jgi:hypothetical protein
MDQEQQNRNQDEVGYHLAWVSVMLAIIGFFAFGLPLSVLAMVLGAVAGARGRVLGWIGVGLGLISLIGWFIAMLIIFGAEN